MPLSPSAGRMRLPRPPRRWTVLPSMASRSRSTRLVPVVMEVAADVAVEDMAEAAVVEDMEAEAMAAAVAVVDMEVVDMVEMVVATEEAVEAAVATAVAAVAMEAAATEVDVVVAAVAMEAVATRPPLDQDHLQKKHFRFKISIHAYLVLFCYAVLSLQNCIFSAFVIGPLQPKVAIQNSVKNPDETL